MLIIYIIVAVFLGMYWKTHSSHFGYYGRNMNVMRGSTIIISMIIWPLALIIKALSGNLLK